MFLNSEDIKDLVISSDHYSGQIETIEFIRDKLTPEQFEGYLQGNIIKYLSRGNKTNSKLNDYKKSLTYSIWLVQHLENQIKREYIDENI